MPPRRQSRKSHKSSRRHVRRTLRRNSKRSRTLRKYAKAYRSPRRRSTGYNLQWYFRGNVESSGLTYEDLDDLVEDDVNEQLPDPPNLEYKFDNVDPNEQVEDDVNVQNGFDTKGSESMISQHSQDSGSMKEHPKLYTENDAQMKSSRKWNAEICNYVVKRVGEHENKTQKMWENISKEITEKFNEKFSADGVRIWYNNNKTERRTNTKWDIELCKILEEESARQDGKKINTWRKVSRDLKEKGFKTTPKAIQKKYERLQKNT